MLFSKALSYVLTFTIAVVAAVAPKFVNRNPPINRERCEKVFFHAICILEKCGFRYNNKQTCILAITEVKKLLSDNRFLAGELMQQYVYDFENASTDKEQKKSFCYLSEYVIKQYNILAKSLRMPMISYRIRLRRGWFNAYSYLFIIKFAIYTLITAASYMIFILAATGIIGYILQKVWPL